MSELDVRITVPDPVIQPTMTVPEAGRVLGLAKASAYDAAHRGDIPCIIVGRRMLVPTAKLRRMLGLDDTEPAA